MNEEYTYYKYIYHTIDTLIYKKSTNGKLQMYHTETGKWGKCTQTMYKLLEIAPEEAFLYML